MQSLIAVSHNVCMHGPKLPWDGGVAYP